MLPRTSRKTEKWRNRHEDFQGHTWNTSSFLHLHPVHLLQVALWCSLCAEQSLRWDRSQAVHLQWNVNWRRGKSSDYQLGRRLDHWHEKTLRPQFLAYHRCTAHYYKLIRTFPSLLQFLLIRGWQHLGHGLLDPTHHLTLRQARTTLRLNPWRSWTRLVCYRRFKVP